MTTTDPQSVALDRSIATEARPPFSGSELVALIDEICAGMTQQEREELADSLDPKWRGDTDNG